MRATLLALIILPTVLSPRANLVIEWTDLTIDAIRLDNSGPTISSRNLAIIHTAIYDAVNSITRTHQPYAFQLTPPPDASLEAAVTGAAHETITVLYPMTAASADAKLEAFQSTNQNTASLELGREIARLALASRVADGSNTEIPYIPSDEPGQWRRTPPFFRPPTAPHWRYVTPFALPNLQPFLSGPPPALDSPEYAAALNEVKVLGSKTSALRTSEQSQIAQFWSDFSYTSMPPGHWHLIADTIAREKNTSLPDSARLFALLSIAQADAAILSWEAKFRYNLWRPITAIQQAETDHNSLTDADPTWDHFLTAPSFPAYTSGHSTFSKASAQVLTHFYGTDNITFTATSDALPSVQRTFTSLAACADEIGMSRIYGGIHFSFDNIEGKKCGQLIGDFVSANWLLPNDRLPRLEITHSADTPTIRAHGHISALYALESSDDLKTWNQLSLFTGASGGFEFQDSSKSRGFYRLIQK